MPPVRGRELKLRTLPLRLYPLPMPPVRGRELKPAVDAEHRGGDKDAPCAGARIETVCSMLGMETVPLMPPVRGRELKLAVGSSKRYKDNDAPCAGARIETQLKGCEKDLTLRCPLCGGEN